MVSVIRYFIEPLPADMTVMCEVSRVQLHVAIQLTFRRVSFITQSAGKVVTIVSLLNVATSHLRHALNGRIAQLITILYLNLERLERRPKEIR